VAGALSLLQPHRRHLAPAERARLVPGLKLRQRPPAPDCYESRLLAAQARLLLATMAHPRLAQVCDPRTSVKHALERCCILTIRAMRGGCGRQASPAIKVTEVYVLCKVGELLTAEVVWNEAGLRAAVARGGEVVVRAGATIELGKPLAVAADCALVGEPGGAAPPVLRRKGGSGPLIVSGQGQALELRGLRLEGGGGRYYAAVYAKGGRLAVRDCEVRAGGYGVWVEGGCRAELHGGAVRGGRYGLVADGAGTHLAAAGVTIEGCTRSGVGAYDDATVALRGCTLRENGTDCEERYGGKIVREEG
jgi:hypothetical protein